MSHTKIILLLFICILAASCTQKDSSHDLTKGLVGEWSNTYLDLTIQGDSVIHRVSDSTNWEQNLGIKPIHTFFNKDGTYRSEYRNAKDSLIREAKGTWKMEGDSLEMMQTSPAGVSYKLHTTLRGNKVIFEGMIDFDEDGQKDDHYLGWQKKH